MSEETTLCIDDVAQEMVDAGLVYEATGSYNAICNFVQEVHGVNIRSYNAEVWDISREWEKLSKNTTKVLFTRR